MSIINEILNNRITYIIGISLSTIILGGIFKMLFSRAEKAIISRIQPPKTVSQVYFDAEMALATANKIPTAGIVADIQGNIVYVNEGTTKLLHWRKEEMIGQNLDMIIPAESRPMHNAALEEYRRTGHGRVFGKPMRVQCLTKGDVQIPVEIIIDEMIVHEKVFIIGKIRDISKHLEEIESIRREANKENEWLKKEVEFYREIERETSGGMMKWLYPKDRVLMTKGMQALFDLHQPECLSVATTARLVLADRAEVGNAVLHAVNGGSKGYSLSFHLLNGRRILISATIRRNKDGLPLVIYGIMHQIKE